MTKRVAETNSIRKVAKMHTGDIVSRTPDVMSGALVFAGTRVLVDALFENLSDGMSVDDFLRNFPSVDRMQVEAVLHLVAEDLKRKVA